MNSQSYKYQALALLALDIWIIGNIFFKLQVPYICKLGKDFSLPNLFYLPVGSLFISDQRGTTFCRAARDQSLKNFSYGKNHLTSTFASRKCFTFGNV